MMRISLFQEIKMSPWRLHFQKLLFLVDENFIGPYKDKAMVST